MTLLITTVQNRHRKYYITDLESYICNSEKRYLLEFNVHNFLFLLWQMLITIILKVLINELKMKIFLFDRQNCVIHDQFCTLMIFTLNIFLLIF